MSDIKFTVEELKKDFDRFTSDFKQLESKVDEIYREIGAKEGLNLSRQIDELYQKFERLSELVTDIARDVKSTRKLTEYGDSRLKEIMQALSLIYRNTDDLEENLIDAENIETR